jgi:hypothetical protein
LGCIDADRARRNRRRESAKADFGPLLPRIHPPVPMWESAKADLEPSLLQIHPPLAARRAAR